MEINITEFVRRTHEKDHGLATYSASIMERGQAAGPLTWRSAMQEAEEHPLLTTEAHLAEARAYFREFGAWDREEIDSWDANTLNALLIQFITGHLREAEAYETEEEFFAENGYFFRADDGNLFFYMGH